MSETFIYRWGILPLWLLLTATIFLRTPIPIDETRYLSVAWEMWLRGDFWVPYLNGQPYSHKPPLLFWLFQTGWAVFGVNEWWPRLVGPLAALLNLVLARQLAVQLWPAAPKVCLLTPWILIATLLWTLFATAAMFDMLLSCCVLLAMRGLLCFNQGAAAKGVLALALGIGLGLLAKGPVVFLHILPVAAGMSFWREVKQIGPNLAALLAALLAGIGLLLVWAVPAALSGGADYAQAIFWHQTVDRTVGTEIHARPFFWYAPFAPLLLFPWSIWPGFWQAMADRRLLADPGLRFCLVWLLGGFLVFSLLPSKQIHYLIPLLPAFALLVARVVDSSSVRLSFAAEAVLPMAFALIGGFLILLPQVPGLSRFHWTQTIQPGWGLAVLAITALQILAMLYWRKLTVYSLSISVVAAIFIGFACFFQYNGRAYDLSPAAGLLRSLNEQHVPCAFLGNYQGQLHFLGRLNQALPTLSGAGLAEWVNQHPEGYLLSLEKNQPSVAYYAQPHREYWLVFRSASQAAALQPL